MPIAPSKKIKDRGLRSAAEAAGSLYKLAKMLGISPTAAYDWQRVPSDRIIEVEKMTGVPR